MESFLLANRAITAASDAPIIRSGRSKKTIIHQRLPLLIQRSRGRTIVIATSLSPSLSLVCLYQAARVLGISPRPRTPFPDVCPHVTNTQDATRPAGYRYASAIAEQPYITARSRIRIYASRIISQLSITSSRLFAGNNGSLLARCSLPPLFLLLSLSLSHPSSLPPIYLCLRLFVLTSLPIANVTCASRETSAHRQFDAHRRHAHLQPAPVDIRVYISWGKKRAREESHVGS